MSIQFGTDGWRAVIADQFTFDNVRRVCSAAARSFAEAPGATAVVGYDTRFLSRRFAETAAGVLMGAGRRVILSESACPTPAASCQVVAREASFAVVITASHNPAPFNGVKLKDRSGSSAPDGITASCERHLREERPAQVALEEGRRGGLLEEVSFQPAHRERLGRMVDLDRLRRAGLRIVVDPMHGACGRLLEELLGGGSTRVTTIHSRPDPLFGGRHPEPLEQNLPELCDAVLASKADAGLATDGDGDRIGAFDETGRFVSPLRIAPLLALSLLRKGRRGPLGKTFANTILLDRIASHHGLPFSVFPVGFKHIAARMREGRMLLGGEESGGIGVEGYIPERDGTLVSLMLLEAMVEEGRSLSELVADLTSRFGELHYRRRDLAMPPEAGRRAVAAIRDRLPGSLGGLRVTGFDDLDGLKLLFGEEGWILFRASGTEPVLRIYSEVPSAETLDKVMAEGAALLDSSSPPPV